MASSDRLLFICKCRNSCLLSCCNVRESHAIECAVFTGRGQVVRSVAVVILITFVSLHTGVSRAGSAAGSVLRPVHTYSIVARDPATGQLGVAVQSHWFSVGQLVPWARAGVGAVATQSFIDVRYGRAGLELMAAGMPADTALTQLLKADPSPGVRQVGMIDAQGRIAQHTGKQCIQYAGHVSGRNFAVQANLMMTAGVPEAMAAAYRESQGTLAERMLVALEAAQALGGDLRGKQSAAILVVAADPGKHPGDDRLVDLHIEDHPTPVKELRRLLKLHTAYRHMNLGDHALERNDIEGALAHYGQAEVLVPGNMEMKFWHAVALVNAGRVPESLPLFTHIFNEDSDWRELVPRLVDAGLLQADLATTQRITGPGRKEEKP
ncbi:MAG: DUF1028 domain-containing protein [Gammaproteobacteria bacterium]|nr:MAG: DUF1028 domain-containing protein [Gammaproteobacteria bacterium]